MTFHFVDEDAPEGSADPDGPPLQASKYVFCPVCDTDRERTTLEEGCCPFCESFIEEKDDEELIQQAADAQLRLAQAQKPPKQDLQTAYEPPKPVIEASVERELASRALCRRRLMTFIKKFRPKYMAGWVHEDICRRLEKFIEDVEQKREPRLLLMMPPRSGKSEIGSRHLPPWVLGKHPEWEIIAASHTSSLTMSFSRYVRDLMRDPAYQAIFPATKLDPSSQSVENWNVLTGGGYLAAGVGTGITGRGANILLLDDLVKDIEAADSDTIRDNTWEWYASTAYTRLAPGGGVLGIMTWWHDDDWAGRIQQVMATGEGDRFEIVKYPAINDEGDEYILEQAPGRPMIQLRADQTPPPGARLTRPMNTAIHPDRYTTEAMLRIKANLTAAGQKRVWQALYQQNPVPDDGLFFTKEMFRCTPSPPPRHKCHVYQAWDFAITEAAESDYTVGSTVYQDENDNLFVVDVRRFRSSDSLYIVDMILDYALEFTATPASGSKTPSMPLLGFEDGQIWKTLEAQFTKRCSEKRFYPSYEVLKPLTDKMVRAHPLRGRMQAGKVWYVDKSPWYTELFSEMTRFPAGKHDDQVDSLAWAVRLTLGRHAPRPAAPPKNKLEKSWKTKVSGYLEKDARGSSHMAA